MAKTVTFAGRHQGDDRAVCVFDDTPQTAWAVGETRTVTDEYADQLTAAYAPTEDWTMFKVGKAAKDANTATDSGPPAPVAEPEDVVPADTANSAAPATDAAPGR